MEQPTFEVLCTKCREPSRNELDWRCRECGSPLTTDVRVPFDKRKILESDYSMWRYRSMLPFVGERLISMGEGLTPLISLNHGNTMLKLDYVMPTGSFKDRGSSAMLSTIVGRLKVRKRLIEDSSGNAGASVAAYSARAGLACEVYTPQKVSEAKAKQIEAYGAGLHRIRGSRDGVSRAAQKARGLYVSHVWNPFFIEGIKTLAYEIAEQLSWNSPEHVFLPVSAGVLLLGVVKGFKEMAAAGTIRAIPTIIGVQPLNVSPVYHAYQGKDYRRRRNQRTVADALISDNPPRLDEMASALRDVKGDCIVLKEHEILEATQALAKWGIYVEPSGAVAYGGWQKLVRSGKISEDSRVILVLTGSGLKSGLVPS